MISTKPARPESALAPYETLEDLSNHMLEAAQFGNWEDLEALRQESLTLTAKLEADNVHASLSKEERPGRLRVLKRIVANDAEIRRLANPGVDGGLRKVSHPEDIEHLPERNRARLTSYSIDNPIEILAHLRKVIERRIAVTVYLDHDEHRYLNALMVHLDTKTARLSFNPIGVKPPIVSLFQGQPCTLVAFIDQVKVQFAIEQLQVIEHSDRTSLTANIPGRFFRAQRRSFYRVRPLFSAPAHCLLAAPGLTESFQEVEILDIGVGGMSLEVTGDLSALDEQTSLPGCFVHLEGHTSFRCDLKVCYAGRTLNDEGKRRIGVVFNDLDAKHQRTIQIYVNSVEANRRRL